MKYKQKFEGRIDQDIYYMRLLRAAVKDVSKPAIIAVALNKTLVRYLPKLSLDSFDIHGYAEIAKQMTDNPKDNVYLVELLEKRYVVKS